jgi:hypothetical protein
VDTGEPDAEQPDAEQPSTAESSTAEPHVPVDDTPVLPSRSSDDLDTGWGDRPGGNDDERFLRDVPPHWGR